MIGIIAAMDQEVSALREAMNDMTMTSYANQVIYRGSIHDYPVALVKSGIGKVNATIAATTLIEREGVEYIINTGSAGGIGIGLSVEDLVIGTQLAHHDADAQAFGYSYGQVPGMPLYYPSDPKLVKIMHQAAQALKWRTHTGLILSGDSFVSSTQQINTITTHFPKGLATEMEGAAVAQCCYQFNVPCVVVRAISDVADEAAVQSFEMLIETVGRRSAILVRSAIHLLGTQAEQQLSFLK